MKNKIIFWICILAMFYTSCKTKERATKEPEKKEQKIERIDTLRVWTQDQLQDLSMKDSLYFYNDKEIKLEKILTNEQKLVKSHGIISIDSTLKIFDVIPAKRAGMLSDEPIIGIGGINILPISFTKDSSIVNMYFVRKGSLQKNKIYKNKRGKIIRIEKAPSLNDPEICIVDSVKVTIKYKGETHDAKFVSGMGATILVSNKIKKGEKVVKREAKGWNK